MQESIVMVWEIEGLPAEGPYPEHRAKLALFGQFVGDWEIQENRYLQDDGTWSKESGRIHWRWILEGRALQDVWSSIDEETGKEIPWGDDNQILRPQNRSVAEHVDLASTGPSKCS